MFTNKLDEFIVDKNNLHKKEDSLIEDFLKTILEQFTMYNLLIIRSFPPNNDDGDFSDFSLSVVDEDHDRYVDLEEYGFDPDEDPNPSAIYENEKAIDKILALLKDGFARKFGHWFYLVITEKGYTVHELYD